MVVQESPQGFDQCGTFAEIIAHIRVDSQIGIALSRPNFSRLKRGIANDGTVFLGHILVSGQRCHRFGKQLEVVDMKRDLTRLRAEHDSRRLNKIAQVEHLVEKIHTLLAQFVDAEEQLNLAVAIFNMSEGNLTHCTAGANAAGKSGFYLRH